MSKCDKCLHGRVCQHRGQYTELEGKLPVTPTPFTSAITCGEYKEATPTPRGLYEQAQIQQTPQWPPSTGGTAGNPNAYATMTT